MHIPSNSKQSKERQATQHLPDNRFYRSTNHFIKSEIDDVEWLSPGRRKPVVNNANLDKNLNRLEHQLAKLQQKHSGSPQDEQLLIEQEEQKKIFLQPSNSASLEDYNVIQTKVQETSSSARYQVDDDDNNENNGNDDNDDDEDDCDNNNNKSGDNKRVNVWKQVELFQAGNAISKNWSLTVQELVLDTEFEQQHDDEGDDVMSEQRQIRNGDDDGVTVYFR